MTFFNEPLFSQNRPENYNEDWNAVKEADNKGLPTSALKIVDKIYLKAITEKNEAQLIKALVHQLLYAEAREDNTLPNHILKLEKELLQAPPLCRLLIHSMLGEMYWHYYQNNRWRFANRTKTTQFDNKDIETWTLEAILAKATDHYLASCKKNTMLHAELTQLKLKAILNEGNTKGQKHRPFLYDFLSHRALDFFKGEEPNLIQPAYVFTLNQPEFLLDAEKFVQLSLPNKDTLSTKYNALNILQELTRFHLRDNDPTALVEIELERLQYVRQHATFSNKLELYMQALEKLEKKTLEYPSSTLVTFELAQAYLEQGQLHKPLQGDAHKWDIKKAYEIAQTAKKRFPDADGAAQCENLQFQILNKTILAQLEEIVPPNKPLKALIQYKNITDLHWRIIKTSREEVKNQRKKYARNYNVDREEKFLTYFIAKTPSKTGKTSLPSDGDYQLHSTEIKLEGLPTGEYLILFSHKPQFQLNDNGLGYAFTTVSTISHIHRSTNDGGTELYTLHRETGESLSNVNVQVLYSKYNYQTGENETIYGDRFTTNQEGFVKLPYKNTEEGRQNFSLLFTQGEDKMCTEKIDGGYASLYQYPRQEQESTVQTFFFLDRGIYRPGQTIFFKGLSVRSSGKSSTILSKRTVKVSLMDVNSQEIASQSFITNEYGTFNGTFTAPSGGLMGQMSLACNDGSGQGYFSVEEYKRPKFEVKFEPVMGSFRLGETISVPGIAQAYSGANIDGAKVQYRVVRKANFPFWWWCRWGYYPSSPQMEITNGASQTDPNGKFSISFQAIPDVSVDKESDPTFQYTVYADITDLNGETHSSETNVSVGYKSLKIGANLPDIDQAHKDTASINIFTTNLAGQFEPTKGTITISKLTTPSQAYRNRLWERPDKFTLTKEEYHASFPTDAYQEEDNEQKWPIEKTVKQIDFDTQKSSSLLLNDLKSWSLGRYLIQVYAKDKFGQEVKEVAYFNMQNTNDKRPELPSYANSIPIKTTAEPSEKAKWGISTSTKAKILYEIDRDGQIIEKQWLVLSNEKRFFEIPIKEEFRGNITIHYAFVKDNRLYAQSQGIYVPYSNKALNITFETFRDKLQPGQKEEWRLKIKGRTADKSAAEMVATLYDASLDVFRANNWAANFWGYNTARPDWASQNGFVSVSTAQYARTWNDFPMRSYVSPHYDSFNWFGYYFGRHYGNRVYKSEMRAGAMPLNQRARAEESEAIAFDMASPAPMAMEESSKSKEVAPPAHEPIIQTSKQENASIQPRSNFNETAFFFPTLQTTQEGDLVIAFTIPEALTKWKMLGFAHTKDLQSGFIQRELVTQKEVMVVPNQPRFFREGDQMTFSAKITNMTEQELNAQAKLEFSDALSGKTVTELVIVSQKESTQNTQLKAKQSAVVSWQINIPEGLQALTYRIVAQAGQYADGEEMTIPVVTNRALVSESLPLPIRGKQTKTYTLDKLQNNKSTTLKHHRYTLEFTSNPAWYAVQALPYLMEYPYECVEQTFSRYYANSIASHIANANPKIKQVFDIWRTIQPDALLSNLEKNQELKSALLEETPWVLQAKDEDQRKRAVALLFDLNRMANEQNKALEKLLKAQTPNGGFTWFAGMPEDRYMTQHILAGIGHLHKIGIANPTANDLATNALRYLDKKMVEDYEDLKTAAKRKEIKLEEYQPNYLDIHFLYARSYFYDKPLEKSHQEAFQYFQKQTKKYWLQNNLYLEGMIALALHRLGDKTTAATIINSLKEKALYSEEMGMYYKQDGGYYWYQAPIETQSLLIEVFDEVANDQKSVEELKIWLLKQKQTQDWKTTKATAEACYALLRKGTDVLASTKTPEIWIGEEKIDPTKRYDIKTEAGTGYFKTSWTASQISNGMGQVKIAKSEEGVAWGAVYWQYFEQLDKITPSKTPLQLKKQLFLQQNTDRGPSIIPVTEQTNLQVGDLVKVRIELRVDRPMEYIHLKDMRAAGLEPISTLSEAKHQDGLWYYESPRDLATNFFIGSLPKGTFVFEYNLRVSQKGNFSNGITSIQCLYAPEFSSHSEGIRIQIK